MPVADRPATSLTADRRASLGEVARRFGAVGLYVFGSRQDQVWRWLCGEPGELPRGPSDVDVGARPGRDVHWSVRDKVLLAIALEDVLGVTRVDLVSLSEADPFVAGETIRGSRLYVQDEDLAAEYELYVLRREGDLWPLERERIALIVGTSDEPR